MVLHERAPTKNVDQNDEKTPILWRINSESVDYYRNSTVQYLRLVVIKKKATSALRSSAVSQSGITALRRKKKNELQRWEDAYKNLCEASLTTLVNGSERWWMIIRLILCSAFQNCTFNKVTTFSRNNAVITIKCESCKLKIWIDDDGYSP
ncbi:hypothetical protein T11_16438 [Trichinella zimbabwensis]|uniref:Uncharacterized protein n=1 Tax=Trichinella zimbabwensis TaxID=268475 RepID=A0A0V1H1L0_9BILA|nr:hypothetical protein T11_16438 [Trichinella zimbabwensis]